MKYTQPPGMPANSAYIDGNRSSGTKGSIVPAAAIEHPQRELAHLIAFSGQTPAENDLEQVRKAIQQMIIAAGGGGGVEEDYLLVSQARARLPFYPEILTADGRMAVTSPGAGSILVPASVACQHRGVYPFNTSDYDAPSRTFATVANKTYHLRWRAGTGLALIDLTDGTYNPGGLKAETDPSFDSGFDDMLIARVVTSSGNVATITNLSNRDRLSSRLMMQGQNWRATNRIPEKVGDFSGTLNWARTPSTSAFNLARKYSAATTINGDGDLYIVAYGGAYSDMMLTAFPFNRYETKFSMLHDDWDTTIDVIYDASFGA